MDRNACRRAPLWKCIMPRRAVPAAAPRLPAKIPIIPGHRKTKSRESRADESVPALYSAPYCDFSAHGCDPARWGRGVSAASGLRAAAGRLSDDPGAYVFPGGEPLRDGLVSDYATRAAIRPSAWAQSDDLDELFRGVSDHAAICARSEYRCGRATGPGLDQRRDHVSPGES